MSTDGGVLVAGRGLLAGMLAGAAAGGMVGAGLSLSSGSLPGVVIYGGFGIYVGAMVGTVLGLVCGVVLALVARWLCTEDAARSATALLAGFVGAAALAVAVGPYGAVLVIVAWVLCAFIGFVVGPVVVLGRDWQQKMQG